MRSLSTLAVALFLASTASAADHYLDASTGSNANPGTSAQPWRTITFALGQPLASGDVLRLRGTFAAPAESFPLSLLPGVSLTTWDSSSTARIDAGTSPCIQIIRPGDHTEEIVGTAGSLVIAGTPAVRIEAPTAATRCTSRIAGCRIEGRFEVLVATSAPAYGGYDVHVTTEDCEIVGDVHLSSNSLGDWSPSEMMSAWFLRCTVRGTLVAENPESITRDSLRIEACTIYGDIRCVETYDADAYLCHLLRNRIIGGSIICDSTPAAVSLLYPIVTDNTVEGGSILITLNGDDDAASVLRNTVLRGSILVESYYLYAVEDNNVDGPLTIRAGRSGSAGQIARNSCHSLVASILDYLTISDNTVSAGGIYIPRAPYYFTISGNRISSSGSYGVRVGPRHLTSLGPSCIDDNLIIGNGGLGSSIGIEVDCDLQRLFVRRNRVQGFADGVSLPSSFAFDNLTIENNCLFECANGVNASLEGGRISAHLHGNVLASNTSGLRLVRSTNGVSVEAWGNIFAGNSTADITPGSLLPSDDVRGNLAEDGSLLDFHPSNISGDPHFVDAANGDFRLRPTSPCIAPGNNPAGGDIGRYQSGLQPTLEVVELGGNLASFRTRGENGDHVILFIAAYPARPAALTFCDGLLGLDAPTILAVLPGIITFGRWDLVVDVPPNLAFTAVLQSLRVDLNAPNECSMTNTRFFRR